jgi:pseudaminic acid cytidylyltransferase
LRTYNAGLFGSKLIGIEIMNRVAIIPARGGSKRLPRKNIVLFMGKPIIDYSISAALACGLFKDVIVSTEDHEIAACARASGAEVVDRPDRLATDTTSVNQVLMETLRTLEAKGRYYEEVCCLFATAPLRASCDIVKAHELLDPPNSEMVIAVSQYPLPPFQALVSDTQGHLRLYWPEQGQIQSQELPKLLVDNGSTYWATTESYYREGTFYGERMVGYEMPFSRSIDIDTQEDLKIVEALHGIQVDVA